MKRLRPTAAGLLTLFLFGCGGDGPLSPVHGKVFFQGKPLPRGTIVFTPDPARGGAGPQASGDIQPDGTFILHTASVEGAVPGWHRVTILALEPPSTDPGAPKFIIPRSLIPEKYRDPAQSGLAFEVLPGKTNGMHFNLE
jgi:hypothetical protein